MKIEIKHNFGQVQAQLDRLQKDIGERALASALNKTMAQGQTQMVRAITGEFNLTGAKVREKLFLRRASFKQGLFAMQAVLESKDPSGKRRAINLINFGARETKAGLTAKLKRAGGRVVVGAKLGFIGNKGRTAFVRIPDTRMASRSKGRGAHVNKIKPLQMIDVPQMFNTRRINAKVVAFIKAKFPEVFEREARYFTERFNRGRA